MMNNQDTIDYRRPYENEVPIIHRFFNEIVESQFPQFPTHALETYKAIWVESKLKNRITQGTELLIVAWQQNSPIGLVYGTLPEGGVGTIIWMIVKQAHQGKKIGKNLFANACQYYKKLGCHKLKLTAPSEQAKDFYLKQGMIIEGFHPCHWWSIDFWSLGRLI